MDIIFHLANIPLFTAKVLHSDSLKHLMAVNKETALDMLHRFCIMKVRICSCINKTRESERERTGRTGFL
jgi:hypothetical protein